MEINLYRRKIDEIDSELTELFLKRLDLCGYISHYKSLNKMPIHCEEREKEILAMECEKCSDGRKEFLREFYENIFEVTRKYEEEVSKK